MKFFLQKTHAWFLSINKETHADLEKKTSFASNYYKNQQTFRHFIEILDYSI